MRWCSIQAGVLEVSEPCSLDAFVSSRSLYLYLCLCLYVYIFVFCPFYISYVVFWGAWIFWVCLWQSGLSAVVCLHLQRSPLSSQTGKSQVLMEECCTLFQPKKIWTAIEKVRRLRVPQIYIFTKCFRTTDEEASRNKTNFWRLL